MSAAVHDRLIARVHGRVQGVGYRYFARSEATRLGLTGWVRNEGDGSVIVVAEGPRRDLDALIARLEAGPSSSRVRSVSASWDAPSAEFSGFQIRF